MVSDTLDRRFGDGGNILGIPGRALGSSGHVRPPQPNHEEETLVVSRSGKQIGRFQIQVNSCRVDDHGAIGKCETPIRSLGWTDDGKWLLIGEEGLNDGSGQRQDDYYLLNLAHYDARYRRERRDRVLAT